MAVGTQCPSGAYIVGNLVVVDFDCGLAGDEDAVSIACTREVTIPQTGSRRRAHRLATCSRRCEWASCWSTPRSRQPGTHTYIHTYTYTNTHISRRSASRGRAHHSVTVHSVAHYVCGARIIYQLRRGVSDGGDGDCMLNGEVSIVASTRWHARCRCGRSVERCCRINSPRGSARCGGGLSARLSQAYVTVAHLCVVDNGIPHLRPG